MTSASQEMIDAIREEGEGDMGSLQPSASVPTCRGANTADHRHPATATFWGLYLGPLRLTWNCVYPKRGRWNRRVIWIPRLWREWDISWPTVRKLKYARRLRVLTAQGASVGEAQAGYEGEAEVNPNPSKEMGPVSPSQGA